MISQLRWKSIAKGLITFVPPFRHLANGAAGSAVSSRYYYSVWLRHLSSTAKIRPDFSWNVVAELGPGDSLGLGICALLSGATHYIGLDRMDFGVRADNIKILHELHSLFLRREPIPGDDEFPGVYPKLSNYDFPHHLLTCNILERSLSSENVGRIEQAILGGLKLDAGSAIGYAAPWDSVECIKSGSVDYLISQAVMEHVDNVNAAYAAMHIWLKSTGVMSHRIDYTAHGITKNWYGHWTVTERFWKIIRGRRAYLINRLPHSAHVRSLANNKFEIVTDNQTLSAFSAPKDKIKIQHEHEDLEVMGSFIIAVPGRP